MWCTLAHLRRACSSKCEFSFALDNHICSRQVWWLKYFCPLFSFVDYTPYFCCDELDSPPFGYEKIYDLGQTREAYDDNKRTETEPGSWKDQHHNLFKRQPEQEHRVPERTPNSTSPQTPSVFYDNHWITQSTLFPFSFHDFEMKPPSDGTEGESPDNPKSQLKCVSCKKDFDTRVALEEHVKASHTNSNRSYTCQFCSKSFSRSWNFQRHVLIHKGRGVQRHVEHSSCSCDQALRTLYLSVNIYYISPMSFLKDCLYYTIIV